MAQDTNTIMYFYECFPLSMSPREKLDGVNPSLVPSSVEWAGSLEGPNFPVFIYLSAIQSFSHMYRTPVNVPAWGLLLT